MVAVARGMADGWGVVAFWLWIACAARRWTTATVCSAPALWMRFVGGAALPVQGVQGYLMGWAAGGGAGGGG